MGIFAIQILPFTLSKEGAYPREALIPYSHSISLSLFVAALWASGNVKSNTTSSPNTYEIFLPPSPLSPLSHRSGVAVKIQTRPRQLSSLSRHEKWPQLTLSRQRLPKAQKSTKKTSSALRLPRMSTLTFEWKQNRPEQSFYCALLSLNDREIHD